MIKILCSDKEDWKTKCNQQQYNKSLHSFDYTNFDLLPKLNQYDLVLPLYEKDIFILNNSYKNQSEKFLTPSNEVVKFCNDKKVFNRHLIENGFAEYIPKILDQKRAFPYILKKSVDEWGLNSHIINSEEKERQFATQLNNPEYFKQEYIIGEDEYTTHFIFDKNKIVYHFTLHFKFPDNIFIKGLQSPSFKTAQIKPTETLFSDLFEQILNNINFSGVGCFNFKMVNGIPKIFELNPRVGGSLPLDLENFINAYKNACSNSAKHKTMFTEKIKNFFSKNEFIFSRFKFIHYFFHNQSSRLNCFQLCTHLSNL